jgi:hypothetical protein
LDDYISSLESRSHHGVDVVGSVCCIQQGLSAGCEKTFAVQDDVSKFNPNIGTTWLSGKHHGVTVFGEPSLQKL